MKEQPQIRIDRRGGIAKFHVFEAGVYACSIDKLKRFSMGALKFCYIKTEIENARDIKDYKHKEKKKKEAIIESKKSEREQSINRVVAQMGE